MLYAVLDTDVKHARAKESNQSLIVIVISRNEDTMLKSISKIDICLMPRMTSPALREITITFAFSLTFGLFYENRYSVGLFQKQARLNSQLILSWTYYSSTTVVQNSRVCWKLQNVHVSIFFET